MAEPKSIYDRLFARVAELEVKLHASRREVRRLESRNAAADWVLKHGVSALASLATRRLRGAAHNEAPTLWEAEESLRSVIAALAPAPEAKSFKPLLAPLLTAVDPHCFPTGFAPAPDAKAQGVERRCDGGGFTQWFADGSTIPCPGCAACGKAPGKPESAVAMRERLGWPALTEAEQDANLAHNLGRKK